jgi:hypothetical protein
VNSHICIVFQNGYCNKYIRIRLSSFAWSKFTSVSEADVDMDEYQLTIEKAPPKHAINVCFWFSLKLDICIDETIFKYYYFFWCKLFSIFWFIYFLLVYLIYLLKYLFTYRFISWYIWLLKYSLINRDKNGLGVIDIYRYKYKLLRFFFEFIFRLGYCQMCRISYIRIV